MVDSIIIVRRIDAYTILFVSSDVVNSDSIVIRKIKFYAMIFIWAYVIASNGV